MREKNVEKCIVAASTRAGYHLRTGKQPHKLASGGYLLGTNLPAPFSPPVLHVLQTLPKGKGR